MFKHACVIGVFLASVGSFAISEGRSDDPASTTVTTTTTTVSQPVTPAVANFQRAETVALRPAANEAEEVRALGLFVKPVPAELAAHLGLEAGSGLLVTSVTPESRAAAAGLQAFDVIVSVDSQPAHRSGLEAAENGEKGLALEVIRSGVEARLAIPAANAPAGFLSTSHLGPEHPFRRLRELDELKDSYSRKAEDYSQRMRDLDQSSREARESAKQEIDALQEACDAQVAEYLAERQRELLALLEASLEDGRITPLRELAVNLEALVPEERIEATDETLDQLAELLKKGLTQSLEIDDQGSEDMVNRARNRFNSLQNELGNLMSERVQRPWSQDLKQVEQHEQRLGKQYQERMQWTAKTLEAIRTKVRDRITCAIERTQEELSKKLRRRLNDMEVPAPGEVEAVLADMHDQIETMTDRFIRRTNFALEHFTTSMERGNDELTAGLTRHLPECEEASAVLDATVREHVALILEAKPLVVDSSWHARTDLDNRYDDLREVLRVTLDDGRDAMRSGSVGLATDLKEHKVVSEDAWRDLQTLLSEILNQAQSDCWKLDGPHLDGRFPKPGENPAPKGEVVLAR